MNQDKAIEWQYVINAQDTIDEKQFMNTIKKWQKQAFTSDKVVKEETERSILFEAYSPQAAFITGYMSATSISVNLLLKIEIKENRFGFCEEGVIDYIDSIGQLHGTWGGLAVQPERDIIEVIND